MNVSFVDRLYQDLVEILYKLSGIKYKMKENSKTAFINRLKPQIENILDSVSEGNTCHKHDR